MPFSWEDAELVVPRVAEEQVNELLEHLESLPNGDRPRDTAADITVELTAMTVGRVSVPPCSTSEPSAGPLSG